jgi:3-phosphoshikimate 1-carboxyvinyltransferase
VEACKAFGATIEKVDAGLKIKGVDGKPRPPKTIIDVGNSGTTIRFMTCIAALCKGKVTLTGDDSIKERPIEPLLASLNDLGAEAISLKTTGTPPVAVTGRLKGGRTTLRGISSQFLSGLLIACPLADLDTELVVVDLKSKPYVEMTLDHLKRVGVKIHHDGLKRFQIPGRQMIQPMDYTVPGDYSSAAFLIAAGFITKSKIDISGLDPDDKQGDKMILRIIEEMKTGGERVISLKDTPDLLPIVAVLGCFADGTTVVKNVEHARLKESDRIASICSELEKMGADVEELEDGVKVKKSKLKGAKLNGHRDHRIVMALAVAGLGASGTTIIDDAELIMVSYPGFVEAMQRLHAKIYLEEK